MQYKPNGDPFKRHTTRHRGVSYRLRADGSKSYSVYWQGSYGPAGETEREALARQAELRGKRARGERVIVPAKAIFRETAEEWFEQKRVRPWTRKGHRVGLDLVLLPRFGSWKLAAIDANSIAKLIRDLETRGLNATDPKRPVRPLSASTINTYLAPLASTLAFGVRRGSWRRIHTSHLRRTTAPRSGSKTRRTNGAMRKSHPSSRRQTLGRKSARVSTTTRR